MKLFWKLQLILICVHELQKPAMVAMCFPEVNIYLIRVNLQNDHIPEAHKVNFLG